MKYIWLSVSPYAPTGYGTVTENIVPRLVKAGNEVCIATKHENAEIGRASCRERVCQYV